MNKIYDTLLSAICAGICIGLGGYINIHIENPYIGALLFTTGLYIVANYNLNLFTGKVGYILLQLDKWNYLKDLVVILIGNFIGCYIIALMGCQSSIASDNLAKIVNTSLNTDYLTGCVRAIFCGFLVFIAVDLFKYKNTTLGLVICIPAFILSGMYHSIAFAYYFMTADYFPIILLIYYVIGNTIGGLLGCSFKLFQKE